MLARITKWAEIHLGGLELSLGGLEPTQAHAWLRLCWCVNCFFDCPLLLVVLTQDIDGRFVTQLHTLSEMGFGDRQANVEGKHQTQ